MASSMSSQLTETTSAPQGSDISNLSPNLVDDSFDRLDGSHDGNPSLKNTDSTQDTKSEKPKILEWTQNRSLPPKDAESLQQRIACYLIDLFATLLPVLFIVLAVLALRLDKLPVEDEKNHGNRILSAMKLGPTTYPIVFIAVGATAINRIARYRAERGVTLGSLEQLIASRSLFNTLENQVSQKSLGSLGFTLIALWVLSPLGGQASLRLLSTSLQRSNSSQVIRYFSTNQSFSSRETVLQDPLIADSLYRASILAYNSTLNNPLDTWGNLKIPRIESLGDTNLDGWQSVDWNRPSFSSLIGLPLLNVSREGNLTFSMQSSYLRWECKSLSLVRMSQAPDLPLRSPLKSGRRYASYAEAFNVNVNGSWNSIFLASASDVSHYDIENLSAPLHVIFASYAAHETVLLVNFTVVQSRVESRVHCHQGQCQVAAMRPSQEDAGSPFLTPLSKAAVADNLYTGFIDADGGNNAANPYNARYGVINASAFTEIQPTIRFIGSLSYTGIDEDSGLLSVSAANLTERFSLLFNTYLMASLGPRVLTGTASQLAESYPPEEMALNFSITDIIAHPVGPSTFLSRLAPATLASTNHIYTAHPIWITILLISSLILFFLSLAGIAAKYLIVAPEILGFVSTMTKDNPYFDLDPAGSALDGFQRAHLLQRLRVQIYDAEPTSETGRIVFGPMAEAHGELSRLRRGRYYC